MLPQLSRFAHTKMYACASTIFVIIKIHPVGWVLKEVYIKGMKMETNQILEELQAMRAEIQGIREDMRHYRGFIGGVAWMVGGMAAAVGFMASYMKGEAF